MKKLWIFLTVLAFHVSAKMPPEIEAQSTEVEVKSEISEVTVYLSGAQITRSKTVDVPAGRSVIKFVNLSPFIDAKSLSVYAKGDLTLLSVNLQHNFLSLQTPSKEREELTKSKKELEKKLQTERAYLEVLSEELAFLKANSTVGGANTGTSLTALKEANLYFAGKFTDIKLKQIERQANVEKLSEELAKVQSQLATLESKKEFPTGEILVSVDSKSPVKVPFEIKYIVSNAGWTPTYDIKVKNISQPAELTYKANVRQSTNEDWKNVKLRLSSSDPNTSNTYRELQPYYLNYYTAPPSYGDMINRVSGRILDARTGEPLIGASVMVKGSSIGTVADINGAYSLSIPPSGGILQVSFIGYRQVESPIARSQMDFRMEQDLQALEEVVVVGYGTAEEALQGKVSGLKIRGTKPAVGREDLAPAVNLVETEQVSRQTSVEFEIQSPYTLLSDGKNLTINIDSYSLPAEYQYFCAPKIDKNAYLTALIVDWEKYNLLEGEASVYFEDTYTGKTLLDTRYMSDTLNISLGKDKGITIDREMQKQFTTKQFLGSKKEETRSWLLSVKNNKAQGIRISVFDQIPVSTLEEIEVKADNISSGKLDPETGIVEWNFQLKPAEKKELDLKYSVRYPKNQTLTIE
ncbi:MAG TPA: DUF4139 domain-containing protein [Prolixibacteraceae bacterium]|jgi:hypothetical protein|nr:DUF4139 domain-containing protein [Prolixibacteraceae bacterium]